MCAHVCDILFNTPYITVHSCIPYSTYIYINLHIYIFSRESKYEIKGSKSRGVREKNVLYSNSKNGILKGKSLKMRQKRPQKLDKNCCT